MSSDPPILRPLDPAERYYWLLDQLGCLSIVVTAQLRTALDPSDLALALKDVQRAHPLLRARIAVVDGDPVFVETTEPLPLTVMPLEASQEIQDLEADINQPFTPTLPLARCRYLPSPTGQRAVLRLVFHHAIADGQAVITTVQQVLRHMAGRIDAAPRPEQAQVPLHDRFPHELEAPAVRRAIAREIQAERRAQPPPAAFPFHARETAGRTPRIDRLLVDPDASRRLRDDARDRGATMNGAIGAAALEAAASLLDDDRPLPIMLLTATDLRRRIDPPLMPDDVQMAAGVLCTPYDTRADNLAATISEQVRREVERGESHLFYRLVRPAAYGADAEGVEAFRRWMASVPQNVALSNIGVVADDGDPDWIEWLSISTSPAPNQVAFLIATTYRGHLVIDVTTDSAKLPAWAIERLVSGIAERLGAARADRGAASASD